MIHGEVVGELWSTVKVPSLTGLKMLIVRPAGDLFAGKVVVRPVADVVAVDIVGAGVGDRVIVALGKAARSALGQGDHVAVEAAIVGIVDDWRIKDPPPPVAVDDAPRPSLVPTPKIDVVSEPVAETRPQTADVASAASSTETAAATIPEDGKKKSPRGRAARRSGAKMRALPPDDATGDLFGDAGPENPASLADAEPPVEKKPRGRKRATHADDAEVAAERAPDERSDDASRIERDVDEEEIGGLDIEPDVPGFADIENVWQDDDLPSSRKDED